jgi:hypothetical protein
MMSEISEIIKQMCDDRFNLNGTLYQFKKAKPIEPDQIRSKERELGWPFPEDYKEFLNLSGAANVFGIQILDPKDVTGRGEYDHDSSGAPLLANTRCFVIFGKSENKLIPGLFAFGFSMDLISAMKDVSAVANGESRPPFFDKPYRVFQADGTGYLKNIAKPFAANFSDFLQKLQSNLQNHK